MALYAVHMFACGLLRAATYLGNPGSQLIHMLPVQSEALTGHAAWARTVAWHGCVGAVRVRGAAGRGAHGARAGAGNSRG